MFGRRTVDRPVVSRRLDSEHPATPIPLLTVVGEHAKLDGKFGIAGSIQIECQVSGELTVGGKLVIGEKGVVHANVQTVDAIIMGQYEGNMVASGNVEITATGRVTGSIKTDSLVISRGGLLNGNVTKMEEPGAEAGQRPAVYRIDEKRAGQQKQAP